MPVFWHTSSPESSASACFGSSLFIFINGRSLPVVFYFIRSTSTWDILLKSSSSLKSLRVMLCDTPLNIKILLFEASVSSGDRKGIIFLSLQSSFMWCEQFCSGRTFYFDNFYFYKGKP